MNGTIPPLAFLTYVDINVTFYTLGHIWYAYHVE